MRPLSQVSFYELLEVPPEASEEEIGRAYEIACATYRPSSLATYSIFSEEENVEILRHIEHAYEVLCDPARRREYDATLGRERLARSGPQGPAPEPDGRGGARFHRSASAGDAELEHSLEATDGTYDGPALRRIRLSRGVELQEISTATKISETYLLWIEENRFADLPAPVYVRGFLKEYAKCLHLDPKRVSESYLAHYLDRRGERV